jgi:hypothetical protein
MLRAHDLVCSSAKNREQGWARFRSFPVAPRNPLRGTIPVFHVFFTSFLLFVIQILCKRVKKPPLPRQGNRYVRGFGHRCATMGDLEAIALVSGRRLSTDDGVKVADILAASCNPCAVIGPNPRQGGDFTDYSR